MDNEFSPVCKVCEEPYGKKRIPKFLPCFHTFCLPCLTALEASVTQATPSNRSEDSQKIADGQDEQQTDSAGSGKEEETTVKLDNGDDAEKAVLCPTCKAPAPIPKGVAGLQTNFYLAGDDSADESFAAVMCDMCEKSSQQPAAHFCQQCSLRICKSCRSAHDKFLSGHNVTPLTLRQLSAQSGGAVGKRRDYCLVHRDQRLAFHCRQCDDSICLHCKLTSHEGHKTVDIVTVQTESQTEIASLLNAAQEQLEVLESVLRRVDRNEQELTRHSQNTMEQITNRYNSLITSVQESRDELIEELAGTAEQAKIQLRAQKSSTSAIAETLTTLLSRAPLARAGRDDVVSLNTVYALKKELEEALLSEDFLVPQKQRAARQGSWTRWTYEASDDSAASVAAWMGQLVEGGGCRL